MCASGKDRSVTGASGWSFDLCDIMERAGLCLILALENIESTSARKSGGMRVSV